MLLTVETSNYIKSKIYGHSYSCKRYVQYVLELTYLEDYIKNGFKGPYFKGFVLDYLRNDYFEEYIALVTEMKGRYAGVKTKQLYNRKKILTVNELIFLIVEI